MAKGQGFSVRIEIPFDELERSLNRWRINKVQDIQSDPNLKQAIAEIYAQHLDPYVPFKTGTLADYKIDQRGNIVYSARDKYRRNVNYAGYQYYADDSTWNRTRKVHPLATSDWADERIRLQIWSDFVKDCKPLVKEKVKSGQVKTTGGFFTRLFRRGNH